MTDETKPWVAKVPAASSWGRGAAQCLADDVQALVTRANEDLDAARARIVELEERMDVVLHAGASTALAAHVFDRAACMEKRIAELETELSMDSTLMHAKALAAERDAALERIAELETAQQWRPMETAPKKPEETGSRWKSWTICLWLLPDGEVEMCGWNRYRGECESEQPIAWFPLPEPPKEGT